MKLMDRRNFLLSLSGSLLAAQAFPTAASPLVSRSAENHHRNLYPGTDAKECWLSVAVPFVIEDPARNYHTDILLTSDSFPGVDGYRAAEAQNIYEVLLYDAQGRLLTATGGSALRLDVPAMQPTLVRCRDLVGNRAFLGSLSLRLRPQGLKHFADLFSAAFVRWDFNGRFTTVHANPDPLQFLQGKFYYSMPVPAAAEYRCILALFNPYEKSSVGRIRLVDQQAATVLEQSYELLPRRSALVNLGTGAVGYQPEQMFAGRPTMKQPWLGGNVIVENETTAPKSFAYLMIADPRENLMATEHPLYQGDYPIQPNRTAPFDDKGSLRTQGLLFSPLLYAGRRVRGVELNTRVYLCGGRGLQENLWLLPFVSDAKGEIAWTSTKEPRFAEIAGSFAQRDTIRLKTFESFALDVRRFTLAKDFAGGMGLAVTPESTHSLMKVEVRAENWGTAAFTHFRPGGRLSKTALQAAERGQTTTDYIISGARVQRSGAAEWDCLLAIMNIDLEEQQIGTPTLEVFGPNGLIVSTKLGEFPPLGCRHLLLSELLPNLNTAEAVLTIRLVDFRARLIMSAVYLDLTRRALALDHGSDRFSTYLDYGCG